MNFKELFSWTNIKHLLVYLSVAGTSVFITKSCIPDKIPVVVPSPVLEPVEQVKDINNKIHSVITQQETQREDQQSYIDSLTKVLKIKDSQLESVTKVTSVIDTNINVPTIVVATTKDTIYTVHLRDNWVDILASAGRDSGNIKFKMWDTLTYSEVNKSTLFKSTRYIDIFHSNPYIVDRSAYSLKFDDKQSFLVIGPYVGYGYTGRGFSPSIGLSLTFPIVKIK